MFNYGGLRLFFLKTIFGLTLFFLGLFMLISVGTYNPEDPGLGKLLPFNEITNFFGRFGAFAASLLIFLFGLYSYLISVFFIFFGIFFSIGALVNNFVLKFFLILVSSLLFNHIISEFVFNYNPGIIYSFFFVQKD